MTTIAEALIEVRADTSRVSSDVQSSIGRSSSGFGRTGSGLGKALGLGILGGATAVATGAAVLGAWSVNLEKEYSRTLAVLQATTKSSRGEMDRLDKLAIQTGKDTVFSANDAAAAMLELARGGISPAEIEAGALKSTMTLAAAGQLDLAEAANISVRAMGAFNIDGKESERVASALAGAANASASDVSSLAQGLAQGGQAAKNAGLKVEDATAVLAAFSNAGLEGSDAGTSLKTMLNSLIPTTAKQKKAMRDLNLDFVDAKGNFLDIEDIAGQLHDRLGGLSEAQRSQALETIFGSDAQRAASVLVDEGRKGIEKYTKATNDRKAAEEQAEAQMSGTAGAMEAFQGTLETVGLQLGKLFAPFVIKGLRLLSDGIEWAVPQAQKLGHWIGGLVSESFDMGEAMEDADGIIGNLRRTWEGLQPFLKEAGETIIPVLSKAVQMQIKYWKFLSDAAIFFWNNALGPTLKASSKGFAIMLEYIADTLDVLGSVPGAPDWIQDVADKAHGAATEINEISDAIHKIPPRKDVDVVIHETTYTKRVTSHETATTGMGGPQDATDTRSVPRRAGRVRIGGGRTSTSGRDSRTGGGTVALTITNWQEGTGFFREVAGEEIGYRDDYEETVGRMG